MVRSHSVFECRVCMCVVGLCFVFQCECACTSLYIFVVDEFLCSFFVLVPTALLPAGLHAGVQFGRPE